MLRAVASAGGVVLQPAFTAAGPEGRGFPTAKKGSPPRCARPPCTAIGNASCPASPNPLRGRSCSSLHARPMTCFGPRCSIVEGMTSSPGCLTRPRCAASSSPPAWSAKHGDGNPATKAAIRCAPPDLYDGTPRHSRRGAPAGASERVRHPGPQLPVSRITEGGRCLRRLTWPEPLGCPRNTAPAHQWIACWRCCKRPPTSLRSEHVLGARCVSAMPPDAEEWLGPGFSPPFSSDCRSNPDPRRRWQSPCSEISEAE